MAWNLWSVDSMTGVRQNPLPVSSFTWARVLNAGGSGTAVVPLSDVTVQEIGKAGIKSMTTPLSRTLVLDWDGIVVYAGLIEKRTYDHAKGVLTIQHADLWSLLQRRLAVDKFEPHVEDTFQTYTALSSATLAKRLVALATSGPDGMNLALPITLPADEAGPITRTYYGYHLNTLADVLGDVINEDGGTDIDFQPRYVDGKLNYLMRTGTVAAPKLTAGTYMWNLGVEQSGVIGLSVDEDSVQLATNVVAIGEGSEVDMLARSERVFGSQYPEMDRVSPYKTEPDLAALSRKALGDLNTFKQPTEQWGFSILAGGTPKVSDLLLGGRATTWVQDDPWLEHGWHGNRIIGFSGDLSETVKLQFQPEVA